MPNKSRGFTLVELLVVISILGILASVGLVAFTSAQMRGRDAQRKSNLKEISSALELYYSDYGKYPDSVNNEIGGCPSTLVTACVWGTGEFTDTKTIYFKVLPKDPSASQSYYYRIVDSGTNQKYQMFAHLENTQDPDLITVNQSCGSGITCNFALTSPNTKPTE